MNFNKHSDLAGSHAFLSASKYHWINYTDDKLSASYKKYLATQRGTELHEYAYQAIRLKRKQPKGKDSLSSYINDAIGFRMRPELVLYYSDNAYGTADTLSFKNGLLRIHDLKTGESPTYMTQLEIYAAYFCLEYKIDPTSIDYELRIYQSDEIFVHKPKGSDIAQIMDTIVRFDKKIEAIKLEELED